MIIKKLDFQDHVFQFIDGEYVMSHVTQKQLDVRVLRLESEDGAVGWGEIARKSMLNPTEIGACEVPLLKGLVGNELARLPGFVRHLAMGDPALWGLAFGLETAYLDLVARRAGLPLYALLGGKLVDEVREYYSLSCIDPSEVAARLTVEAKGFDVVQAKLGTGDRQADGERIQAALATLDDNQTLLADFNGALSVDCAGGVLAEFDDPRIVWEEPCNSIAENTKLAQGSKRPIMFDQCLRSLDDIARVVSSGVAHSVCLKPPFLGGLGVARAARDLCIAARMPMRVDGPWCAHIATSACLHLAVGVPVDLLVAGCDLRQPLLLNEDWGGTEHLPNHRIAPSSSGGHGARPVRAPE